MDTTARDAFLDEPLVGALSVLRPDGSPHAVPVWYHWDDGRVVVFADAGSGWVGWVERDPRVAFTVFEHVHPLRAVYIRGAASVRLGSLPELRDQIRGIVARYRAADKVEATIDEYGGGKVVVTITPGSIRFIPNS